MCYARVGEIGLSGDGVYEDAWDLTKRLLHETHDRNVRPEYKNILDEMDNLCRAQPPGEHRWSVRLVSVISGDRTDISTWY